MAKLSDLKVGSQVRALSTGDGDCNDFNGMLIKGAVYTVCEVVDDETDPMPAAIAVPNDPVFHDGFWVTLDNIELVQEGDAE